MINTINPNLYTQGAYTPQTANAVNIQIFNPQAFSSPKADSGYNYNVLPTPQYAPINTPVYYTPNPVSQTQANAPINQPSNVPENKEQPNNPYIAANNNEDANAINNNAGLKSDPNLALKDNKENDKNSEAKPKVILTDDYIKNLENYLNSQDPKVRLMGAKELLERFKEDESRSSDKALNALLNKTIQDPNDTVKFVGLTILDAGYSKGNDETVQILKNIQQNTSSQYGEDSLLASQILLKMSAKRA